MEVFWKNGDRGGVKIMIKIEMGVAMDTHVEMAVQMPM